MNIIFISPHFPLHFWNFCDRLKRLGVNVLGIGDCPYDNLTNEVRSSLTEYMQYDNGTTLFSTTPLDDTRWQPVPFLTLQVYRQGHIVYQGIRLSQEYIDPEKDFEYKNIDYSNL